MADVMGKRRHPLHRCWRNMVERCRNPKARGFHNYGPRGITVCERWATDFWAFVGDMGERPSPLHSLERIDNDGPYQPGNVRWATPTEQNRNTRMNRLLTFDGRTQCAAAWAQELDLPITTLHSRLTRGWSIERALSEAARPKQDGIAEKCREAGLSYGAVRYRVQSGHTLSEALSHPDDLRRWNGRRARMSHA